VPLLPARARLDAVKWKLRVLCVPEGLKVADLHQHGRVLTCRYPEDGLTRMESYLETHLALRGQVTHLSVGIESSRVRDLF